MAQVRLFAGAADAVGVQEVTLPAATSEELIVALASMATSPASAERVLRQCSLLVNGVATTGSAELQDDSRVDVLPPFAGG